MNSVLKQWFSFTYEDTGKTNLIYYCTNNHYIHTWLERHGYTEFKNIISDKDLESFICDLNESSNSHEDDFDTYFPPDYIGGYTLWNMDVRKYWRSVSEYKDHVKVQMCDLFDNLWEVNDMIEDGVKGRLEYNIYYNY